MTGPASQFENRLTTGLQMVARLRDWESGDTVYGVTTARPASHRPDYDGESGKTFTEDEYGKSGEEMARERFEDPPLLADDADVFLWRATIESVQTEPQNPHDPGEPPLKHARLREAEVLDFKLASDA